MADIQVTLVLDDQQYTGKITAATKAAEEFGKKASAQAKEAGSAFEGLAGKIEGINKKLEGFGSVLVGVGLAEFVKGVLESGEQATKMAEAFGITTQSMLELNLAAQATGLSQEKAANMMNKMLVGAQQAADGNMKLKEAFNQLGTSTDYLRTHSADEAFARQVHALAAMEDPAKRAELAMQLFGKAARGTDWKELDDNLQKYNGTQAESAKAAEDAREVMERMSQFVAELKIDFLALIDPLLSVGGGFVSAKVAATALLGVMGAFAALKVAGMFIEAAEAVGVFSAALVAGEIAAAPIIAAIAAVAAVVGGVGYLAYKAFGKSAEDAAASTDKLTEAQKKQAEQQKQNVLSGKDLNPNAGAEQSLKNQFAMLQLNNQKVVERLNLERDIAGLSDEQKKSALAGFDAQAAYDKESLRINGEITKLTIEQANKREGAVNAGQINLLKEQLKVLKDQKDVVAEATAEKIKAENVAAMGRFYDEEKLKVNKNLLDLQVQLDQLTMSTDQRTIDNIKKQITAEQELALKKRQAQLGVGESINPEEVIAINKKIADSYQPVIDKTQQLIDKSREFNTGWEGAFNQYVSDATNAANQGKAAFDAVTNAMNSAIDNFVTTGKFSFADFTTSVIQDLEKIALKAAAAQVLKASGMGSLFAGAFADGGTIPAGQFGLVGEAGPELVKGPATVTSAKDTAASMGGNTSHNTYNINAIDSKSVAQLFAENRMTLFGTVEQARRELPMRTR